MKPRAAWPEGRPGAMRSSVATGSASAKSTITAAGPPSATVTAGTLSGGNQQKMVVAREFDRDLRLLVLDQPTRGLDVGSVEFIHRQTVRKRDAGTAVLLVSAELDEVLELSDRIGVMYRGKMVAILDGPTASREHVGLLMATGGHETPEGAPQGAAAPEPRRTGA